MSYRRWMRFYLDCYLHGYKEYLLESQKGWRYEDYLPITAEGLRREDDLQRASRLQDSQL